MSQRSATRNTTNTHRTTFDVNAAKYPKTNCLLNTTIAISLLLLFSVFTIVLMGCYDPPLNIEIENNSSSETPLNETALNQTALNRQFNKIYTYLTSAGSDTVSGHSFKVNVKNKKIIDTGIALAVFFFVLITVFICALGKRGIRKEDPKLVALFHYYIRSVAGIVVVMTAAFVVAGSINEIKIQCFSIKPSPDYNEQAGHQLVLPVMFALLDVYAGIPLCCIFWAINKELKKMETTNMGNTLRPSAPNLATSIV